MLHMQTVTDSMAGSLAQTYGGEYIVKHSGVTAGSWDAWLTRLGQVIGTGARRTVVRLNYEFESKGMAWGADPRKNPKAAAAGNTIASWVAAWKKSVNVVRAGVNDSSKVGFFWCTAGGATAVSTLKSMYPGNAHVDYIGFDFYVWGYEVQSKLLACPAGSTIRTNNGTTGRGFGAKGSSSDVDKGDLLQFLTNPGGSGGSRPRSDGSIYRVNTTPRLVNPGDLRFEIVKVVDGTTGNKVAGTAVSWSGTLTAGTIVRHAPKAAGDLNEQLAVMRRISNRPIMIGEFGYYGKRVAASTAATASFTDPDTGLVVVDSNAVRDLMPAAEPDVAETTASTDVDDDLSAFRRKWIGDMLNILAAQSDFRAAVYFDLDMTISSLHPQWMIAALPSSLKKWASKLREPKLSGGIS